jgi:hypothetical protein
MCGGCWILFSEFWIVPRFEDNGSGGIMILLLKTTCGE